MRDRRASDLDPEPGLVGGRARLEATARRNPRTLDELMEVPDMRRWQAEVLGEAFIAALGAKVPDESPYKSA